MPPKKASSEQYRTLVNLVEDFDCIRYGKGTPEMKNQAWQEIANSVNALGGIEKAPEGWKKAFTEMKSHIKSKIRAGKPLNEIEKKCALISGLYVSCHGMADIPEVGVSNEYIVIENEGSLEETPTEVVAEIEPVIKEMVEDEQLQPHATEDEKTAKEFAKRTGTKKKPPKSTQLLLDEHVQTTNKGLQDIATSIQAVADAINNVALAIRAIKE